ncbi:hypothetical protein [Halostagnicola bangensis]
MGASYERDGDAVTGDAEINLGISYIDDGSPSSVSTTLEEPSGRDEGWNYAQEQFYIPSNVSTLLATIEIYVEASTGGGAANTDYFSGDRCLYPDYIEFDSLD